jgi:hypothetical protein
MLCIQCATQLKRQRYINTQTFYAHIFAGEMNEQNLNCNLLEHLQRMQWIRQQRHGNTPTLAVSSWEYQSMSLKSIPEVQCHYIQLEGT